MGIRIADLWDDIEDEYGHSNRRNKRVRISEGDSNSIFSPTSDHATTTIPLPSTTETLPIHSWRNNNRQQPATSLLRDSSSYRSLRRRNAIRRRRLQTSATDLNLNGEAREASQALFLSQYRNLMEHDLWQSSENLVQPPALPFLENEQINDDEYPTSSLGRLLELTNHRSFPPQRRMLPMISYTRALLSYGVNPMELNALESSQSSASSSSSSVNNDLDELSHARLAYISFGYSSRLLEQRYSDMMGARFSTGDQEKISLPHIDGLMASDDQKLCPRNEEDLLKRVELFSLLRFGRRMASGVLDDTAGAMSKRELKRPRDEDDIEQDMMLLRAHKRGK